MARILLFAAWVLIGACGDVPDPNALHKFPTADGAGVDQVAFPEGDVSPLDTAAAEVSKVDTVAVGCTEGAECDDGNACTVEDICTGGVCVGVGKSCDDGVACTNDACAADVCVYTLKPGHCFIEKVCYADGDARPMNPCERCLAVAAGEAWTVQPNGTVCEDGDSCTLAEICTSGSCQGQALVCPDDGDPCTQEACHEGGCATSPVPNGGGCDDGDPCTVGDSCLEGDCKAGPEGKDEDNDGAYDAACIGGNDCDDQNAALNPGQSEVCDDALDNDCDGYVDIDDIDCASPVLTACTYHTDCYPEKVCAVWYTTGAALCSVACAGDIDCTLGEVCTKLPGSANVGFCQAQFPGGAASGEACAMGANCASGACLDGSCAEMCLDQTHCLGGFCTLAGEPQQGAIYSLCDQAPTLGLLSFGVPCTDGINYSGDFCASAHCDLTPAAVGQIELSTCAPLCKTRDDCGPKQECNLVLYASQPNAEAMLYDPVIDSNPAYSAMKQLRDTAAGCYSVLVPAGQAEGNLPDGTPCQNNVQCASRLCMGIKPGDPTAYCTRLCAYDENCATGMQCKLEVANMVSSYLEYIGPDLGLPMKTDWWTYVRLCKFE